MTIKISIASLSKKYGKGDNYMRTIMSRAEFDQYCVCERPLQFISDDTMHNKIKNIIHLKDTAVGRSCRHIY